MPASNKLREELAQKFLDALNQGRIPWHACWAQSRPENAITGKTYRGVNAIALSYAADDRGYTDPRWCTYNQAQEKGWQVRKGEKGARVEYWAYYDLKEKKLLSWTAVRDKLKADPDYEKNLQLRCRVYSVFNAEQIDGIPALEERPQTDIGTLRAQRDTLIRNMGIGYAERGNQAYYSPRADAVTLPPEASFDDTYSYMATFLHECGHATGAAHRLNRDLSGFFGSESYAREELRAEIASAFTAQSLGLHLMPDQLAHHTQLHAAYVQHWAAILKDAPDELFRAIKTAEGISDYLIEKGEFNLEHTLQKPELKEWHIVYESSDAMDGTLAIVPTEKLQGREILQTVHCTSLQEATEKLERYEDLQRYFWDETDDPASQEWRDDLTANEADMVEQWDIRANRAMEKLASAILERSVPPVPITGESGTARYRLEEIPDSSDLLLRFYGHGQIGGYHSVEIRPWQEHIGRIREVVIEERVSGIGRNALRDYPALEKITWPGSIRQTDPSTLRNCPSLREIAFSGGPQRSVEAQDLTSPHVLLNLANRYPELTREQLSEVAADLRDGASWEEISIYAKPDFSALQMNAIRYARDSGVTPEQLEIIANPQFQPVQIDIIRNGFLWGMTMEQVQTFAQPGVTPCEMLQASAAIRGELTAEETTLMERLETNTAQGVVPDLAADGPTLTMGG